MSKPVALRLGPFIGGINSGSDASAVADAELVDCVNFELDIDGSLVQRPPIIEVDHPVAINPTAIGSAILNNTNYIVYALEDQIYLFDGTTFTAIGPAGLDSKCALQYRDNIYIIATEASGVDGGYWDGVSWNTDASMPRGASGLFTKSRLFVVPGPESTTDTSRLSFSDPITGDALSWPAINIIDVSPGDGQKLVDVVLFNDNLLLFKQDSTYVLAYDLQPSDAILRCINTTIGATSSFCVKSYENAVYTYHEGKVFEIVNYTFEQINIKVPFTFDGATPSGTTRRINVFLSTLGDRLLVRYYNRVYAFGLKTRTWTRWESANEVLHNFGPLVALPSNPEQDVNTKYYAGTTIQDGDSIIYIPAGWDSVETENALGVPVTITSYILTKNFDLADSHHFKKLAWWGADVLTNQDISGLATPVAVNFKTTWLDLHTKTWSDLHTATWAAPLTTPNIVQTDVDISTTVSRKFVKFQKALRFRQVNFKVVLQGDGSTSTGPCRLFTLTAIIGSKETVVSQVS